MIRKILIANRGEIARRIIRTCQRLGIQTVAVYSDADESALHVREADVAVRIGPPPVAQSYLQIQKLVEAALETGADAVHPGYGLLSENAEFARACTKAGLVFIGPDSSAIEAMGSKTQARKLMKAAGVPTVPGSDGAIPDVVAAVEFAHKIGYPVMLKASHGGGGIGMQVVDNDADLEKAFTSGQARAKAYFGNGEMFMEKRIVAPRHVEIQVLFDQHGHGVYLWERECSIQRRHQKVIEEAPSPFLDDTLRQAMGEAALLAARSIDYSNAGTVEFLVDANRNFYFLEMNTRLQVEHPVTEMITGVDLVELQIQIANGAVLPFRQEEIARQGHAIECRIYAEDPEKMLPSPGTISSMSLPQGEGVRNDVGAESNTVVTPFYDPMIGKLIVHGASRSQAIEKMKAALQQYEVSGIKTNIPLLHDIVSAKAFADGDTTTNFIDKLKGRV
ncbi:acetyl-CoA carboxylase biotin carboxylase subunit [Alicyclobacillus tolerans]|uniref:acetyl-CoA carboxylase biotin carboxylase subunit n=1 Tax=Alicyclobacillus tolerans TaxID=90970 RepID=UPI001F004FA9|nr:acetyl-CoA carboxylase biotin carboxylase subunit [Alicyclobacillus tolerans]MCF8564491.1 acetyl-CoA carboxylase biotin carboxylase subunit [Alicyclobacillus tolerans]